MTNPGTKSGRRLGILLVGFALYFVTIIVACLSFPNFTLFWGQDALPIISQIMWYTFIVLMGVAIGYGIHWRAPYNAKVTKRFHQRAARRLVTQNNARPGIRANVPQEEIRRY